MTATRAPQTDTPPAPGGSPAPADEVVKMAYDAAVAYLKQQDTSLANLRNRATWLVTAAGILASLAASVGLLNSDATSGPVAPDWLKLGLLGTVTLIGISVVAVTWAAKDWTFGPSAAGILEDEGKDETDVRRAVTQALCRAITRNNSRITWRSRVLAAGFVLLIAETFLIVLGQLLS